MRKSLFQFYAIAMGFIGCCNCTELLGTIPSTRVSFGDLNSYNKPSPTLTRSLSANDLPTRRGQSSQLINIEDFGTHLPNTPDVETQVKASEYFSKSIPLIVKKRTDESLVIDSISSDINFAKLQLIFFTRHFHTENDTNSRISERFTKLSTITSGTSSNIKLFENIDSFLNLVIMSGTQSRAIMSAHSIRENAKIELYINNEELNSENIYFSPLFNECAPGNWTLGLSREKIFKSKEFCQWLKNDRFQAEGGESGQHCQDRIATALFDILKQLQNTDHGTWIFSSQMLMNWYSRALFHQPELIMANIKNCDTIVSFFDPQTETFYPLMDTTDKPFLFSPIDLFSLVSSEQNSNFFSSVFNQEELARLQLNIKLKERFLIKALERNNAYQLYPAAIFDIFPQSINI
ncbi:MAG: histidine phosphatase family protein [Alphaproteobacteria bacterium]|nr:histidine phosphatase family protein [Alphaproteobacteria bacterium]